MAPGDGTVGMNVAAAALAGSALRLDMHRDIFESAAHVHDHLIQITDARADTGGLSGAQSPVPPPR